MKDLQEVKTTLLQEAIKKIQADASAPLDGQLKEALKEILDVAKVPMRVHMQVLEALGNRVKEHDKTVKQSKKDHEDTLSLISKYEQHIQFLRETSDKEHAGREAKWDESKNHILSIEHLKGEPGKDAEPVDEEVLVQILLSKVLPLIPEPIEGKPGKDAVIDEDSLVKTIVQRLQKDKPLDLSHIKGAQSFIKDGVRYRFEELMHGGGKSGSTGNVVYNEVVSGSGTAWTLAKTPTAGSLQLYANGQRLTPTVDYSISGTAITTVLSWSAGTLLTDYAY